MKNRLLGFVLALSISLIAGCSQSNDAELAKAKAEAEAAKAELARLNASQSQPQPVAPVRVPAPVAAAPASGPAPLFEDSLSAPDTLDNFHLAYGQYGGRAMVEAGLGMKLGFGHTAPIIWAKPYLDSNYRIALEVQLNDTSVATWVLNGPGVGISADTGYLCRLEKMQFSLLREGQPVQSTPFSENLAIKPGEWAKIEAEVNGGKISVKLNDVLVAKYNDAAPLAGPMHGWFGLYGADQRTVYRNLRIWSSETNSRLERQLTPTVTEKPLANGQLLYEMNLSADALKDQWWQLQPEHIAVKKEGVVLSGPNGFPAMILKQPFNSDLAWEIELEYPAEEVVNFSAMIGYAQKAPESIQDCDAGWLIGLPNLHGRTAIQWHRGTVDAANTKEFPYTFNTPAPIIASTPYHAPISKRTYLVRLETRAEELLVYLDGGLQLKARHPVDGVPAGSSVFLGMSQVYGGSQVHAVRVYQIAR